MYHVTMCIIGYTIHVSFYILKFRFRNSWSWLTNVSGHKFLLIINYVILTYPMNISFTYIYLCFLFKLKKDSYRPKLSYFGPENLLSIIYIYIIWVFSPIFLSKPILIHIAVETDRTESTRSIGRNLQLSKKITDCPK